MRKLIIFLVILTIGSFFVFGINQHFAFAQENKDADISTDRAKSSGGGITDPLGLTGNQPIPELIGRIITAILGLVGSIALLMFIYGGFTWMTAAGKSERVQKGKDIIIWAVIGLVVIFTSYAAVQFIITAIATK